MRLACTAALDLQCTALFWIAELVIVAQACTSPQKYTNLPDGNYEFSVRAKGERIASSQSFKLVSCAILQQARFAGRD